MVYGSCSQVYGGLGLQNSTNMWGPHVRGSVHREMSPHAIDLGLGVQVAADSASRLVWHTHGAEVVPTSTADQARLTATAGLR